MWKILNRFTWTGSYIRLEFEDPWVTWDYVIHHICASGRSSDSCPKRQYTWTELKHLLFLFLYLLLLLLCFHFEFALIYLTRFTLINSKFWFPTFNTHMPINWMVALSNWIGYCEESIHSPPELHSIPLTECQLRATQYNWIFEDTLLFLLIFVPVRLDRQGEVGNDSQSFTSRTIDVIVNIISVTSWTDSFPGPGCRMIHCHAVACHSLSGSDKPVYLLQAYGRSVSWIPLP